MEYGSFNMWTAGVAYFVISWCLIWRRGLLSCYSLDFCWIIYLVCHVVVCIIPFKLSAEVIWNSLEFCNYTWLAWISWKRLKRLRNEVRKFARILRIFCWLWVSFFAVTLIAVRCLWLRYVLFPFLFSCFFSYALIIDLVSIHGDKILNILTILCWVCDLEKEKKKMKIVIGAGKIQCYFITGCNIVQVLRMWISV